VSGGLTVTQNHRPSPAENIRTKGADVPIKNHNPRYRMGYASFHSSLFNRKHRNEDCSPFNRYHQDRNFLYDNKNSKRGKLKRMD